MTDRSWRSARRNRRCWHAGRTLVALVLFGSADFVDAQRPTVTEIPREPQCPRCSISVGPPRFFGDADGPGSFTNYVWAGARDSHGNYYFAAGPDAPPIKFDARGQFVATIGAMGPGPGEFQRLSTIWTVAGDSLYVTDRRSVHVFGPRGTFVRASGLPVVTTGTIIRRDGSAVLAGSMQASGAVGHPFHFLPPGMRSVTKSVGTTEEGAWNGHPPPGRLRLAASRDAGFWVIDGGAYRLTRWDSSGVPRQILTRDPEWWTEQIVPRRGDTTAVPPGSGIQRVVEDANGRLWIAALVPGTRWREGWGPRLPGGGYLMATARMDLLYDTMIDVIDPRSGRLVTSVRVPGCVVAFLGSDEILLTTEDNSGIPRAAVRKVTLNLPPSIGH